MFNKRGWGGGEIKGIKRLLRTHGVRAVVIKNWEPFVFLPALAMERRNGSVCFKSKFSSKKKIKIKHDLKFESTRKNVSKCPFTSKFWTINGLSTSTIMVREVPTLSHELLRINKDDRTLSFFLQRRNYKKKTHPWDDSMEMTPRIPKPMLTSS